MSDPETRLAERGLQLPVPPTPAGSYVTYTRTGNLIFVAGQTCLVNNETVYAGVVGEDITLEQAQHAAQICALNSLAIAGDAVGGDLSSLRALRLTGYVRATADFDRQTSVIDGASDLLTLALGDRGRHARAAIGVHSLPRRAPVEIETLFEVQP